MVINFIGVRAGFRGAGIEVEAATGKVGESRIMTLNHLLETEILVRRVGNSQPPIDMK